VADTITSPTTTPEAVLAAARKMLEDGLVEGTSGNISGRLDGGLVCLSPSSVAYDTMTLDDLVIVDLEGTVVQGTRSPTTEKDLHLSALRRYPELGCVIHTHAVYATMFALAHEPIPAVIEEVVVYVGGDVPCCEYKGTGSRELGEEVAAWSRAGRRPRRRCTTRPSWSAPPRSCGGRGRWGRRSTRCPRR
jgi:L-fuculose-phosphate aldolase